MNRKWVRISDDVYHYGAANDTRRAYVVEGDNGFDLVKFSGGVFIDPHEGPIFFPAMESEKKTVEEVAKKAGEEWVLRGL